MRKVRIRYSFRALLGDISGGIIAALIALPYGLALSTLMGLPPVLGVFTSLLTAPVTALLGRNPVLIGGTASATVPFISEAVRQQGVAGATKVTLAAAIFLMIFSVLRWGGYISKVPTPVVTGFSCGIGGMMVLTQWKALEQNVTASAGFGSALGIAIAVTVACFAVARFWPKAPAPLLAVAFGVALARIIGFQGKQVGHLELTIPPFAGFAWSARDVYTILPAGFGLAFVAGVNILITSRVVEHFRGWGRSMRRTDGDVELGAYGIANVVAGIFGAPLSVGIPARSLANIRSGGSTRASNLFHAAALAAIVGMGSTWLSHIPMATLAGVTAWIGCCLLDWSAWRRIPKMRKVDATALLATAVLVLTFNAVAAVAAGCAVYGVEKVWKMRAASGAPKEALSENYSA